jgi:DNA invertase Pin-like site-specific DNA recombinase
MQASIGYLRVSTREQGRSGLGLAAQRQEIEAFGAREGFSIKSWHQDVQTGAGADALLLRPGLATALKEARAARCPLIVSRLDRLSRNVHFITGLMEHRVHFIVAALGRDCDEFTLHIYASLAEQERKLLAERCKAAAETLRAKGHRFGFALRPKAAQRRARALGAAALTKAANERAEAYWLHIEWALRQPGVNGRPISYHAAAEKLNERNIELAMGGRWVGQQLLRMARRLGLNHPLGRLSREVARARVQAMYKEHPEFTVKQVKANLGLEHPLDYGRALGYLRECRMGAAKRNPTYKRMGWYVDRWIATRLRIAAIWKRHPEFTGREVLQKLQPEHTVRLPWVQRILRDCWLAGARHSRAQRLKGRRLYTPYRACDSRTIWVLKARAAAGSRKAAMKRAEPYRAVIEWALRQPGKYGRPILAAHAAEKLNERHIRTPRGGRWHASSVRGMWRALGLHHPPAGTCRPSRHALPVRKG